MIGGQKFAPGVYENIPNDAYRKADGVSQSDLKQLLDTSPGKLKGIWDGIVPKNETKSMKFGTAAHHKLAYPKDPLPPGHGLKPEEVEDIDGMIARVYEHPEASKCFSKGRSEVSFFWEDPSTGIMLKGRVDHLPDAYAIVPDYKTCLSVKDDAISRTIGDYGWDVQQAFYETLCNGLGIDCEKFYFVAQEKSYPYFIQVIEVDPIDVEEGRETFREALDIYAQCVSSGVWPETGTGIKVIGKKPWARKRKLPS